MAEQFEQPAEETADQAAASQAQITSQLEYYAPAIGAFKDDPMLDAMMANIHENKKKMNADDNIR